jgi:hypothetical protein
MTANTPVEPRQARNTACVGRPSRQLRQVAADVEALDRLLDDTVVYTGPDGRVISKGQDLQAYRSGALGITSFVVHELDASVNGRNGTTRVRAAVTGEMDGQSFTVRLRYVRDWIEMGGSWRVVAARGDQDTVGGNVQ